MSDRTPDPPLPEHCTKELLVLCCGNPLFGDDGFGPAVAQRLLHEGGIPEHVGVIDAGTSVRELLFDLLLGTARLRRVVLVDAIDAGRVPGEILELGLDQLPRGGALGLSSHHPPTATLLHQLHDSVGVQVDVIACQVSSFSEELREGLSPPVGDAVGRAVAAIARRFFAGRGGP